MAEHHGKYMHKSFPKPKSGADAGGAMPMNDPYLRARAMGEGTTPTAGPDNQAPTYPMDM